MTGFLILLVSLIVVAVSADRPPPPLQQQQPVIVRNDNCFGKQDLQQIVAVIEEKFRSYERHKNRNLNEKLVFEDLIRKFDDRLTNFERKFEWFLQSVNGSFGAENRKKDANRKIDLMYERVDHRIGFVEAKLYTSFINLQLSSEKLIKRIEKLERNFETKQTDIEHELGLVVNAFDEIRLQQFNEKRFANFTNDIVHAIVDRLSTLNIDSVKEQQQRIKKISEFDDLNETDELFNSKNTNQMNQYEKTIWKLFENIQNTLKITMSLQNLTRRELQDNYKSLLHQFSRIAISQHSKIQSNSSVNNTIDLIVSRIEQKLNELRSRQDTKLNEIVFNQKLFMENCHRIQLEEQQLDSKISLVLERLLDMFINTTSGNHFEYKQIQNTLESHDYQIKDLLNEGLKKILEKLLNDSMVENQQKTNTKNDPSSVILIRYIQKQLYDLRSKIVQIDTEISTIKCPSLASSQSLHVNTQTKLKQILITLSALNRQIIEHGGSSSAATSASSSASLASSTKSKLDDDYETGIDNNESELEHDEPDTDLNFDDDYNH